jgi:hypothetical protein
LELKQIAEYALKQTGVREAAAEWDALDAAQRRAASGGDVLTKQVEIQEKAVTRIGARLEAYARANDPLMKALANVERGERLVAAARAKGIEVTDAQTASLARARQKYEDLRSATAGASNDNQRLRPHELLNIGRQGQDAITMLAMGASPMQVVTSQGAQVYDALASSSIGAKAAIAELGATALRVATHPLTILAASVTAAAGASVAAMSRWKSATDELQASLDGLGRTSGLSLTGARGLAESAAAQSGLSLRSSSNIVSGALGAGLDAASAGGVASIAKEFSVKLGVELDDVAKELTGALSDPAKGADELARRYGLVTMAQAHHIDQLVKVGDRSGAAAELLRDLHQALNQIADRRSPFSRLIDRLETGASDALMRYGEALANNPANATVNRLFGIRGNESASTVFSRMRSSELQRRQAERQADIAGQDIFSIARETAPDLFARRDIEAQIEKFQRALGKDGVGKVLDQLGVSGDTVRQTLDRMRVGLELLQSPVQRVTEANSLAARSAEAETAGQRAQIAAEQAFRAELQSSHDRLAAVTAAEGARNVVLLESARAMREQAKQAERRAELAGLGPYERAVKQAEFTLQDNLKKADTAPGAGADMSIYDRSVVVPFDKAGSAATRLADALTTSADRIGRLVSLPEQKAATTTATPFFARGGVGAGNDFYSAIMRAEGTARFGNPYDVSLGYRASPKPLTQMTMAESLAWGEEIARQEMTRTGLPRNRVSSAKGAFQVVNSTQRDAMRALGLGANDMFSAENQNRIADWIFKTQGLGAWEGLKKSPADASAARAASGGAEVGDQAGRVAKTAAAYREYNAELRAIKSEQVDNWLREENQALDEQRRAIDLASGAWGLNKGAIAAAEEKQRLLAEAQRRTIPITEELSGKIEKLSHKAADNATAQDQMRRRVAGYDLARSSVGDIAGDSALALARGEDVGAAAKGALARAGENLMRQSIGNIIENFMGAMGSDSLGPLGSLLGIGGGSEKNAANVNIKAANVNLSGAGLAGGGGLLDKIAGGGNSGGGFLGGLFSGIGDFIGGLFKFENGGIMTSAGALPLHRYATGGIADRPQLALFGEGRGPEAFVPLPDGRRIPVHMTMPPAVPPQVINMQQPAAAPKISFNNYAPNVEAIPRVMSDGEIIVEIRKTAATMIAANNKKQAEAGKRAS